MSKVFLKGRKILSMDKILVISFDSKQVDKAHPSRFRLIHYIVDFTINLTLRVVGGTPILGLSRFGDRSYR